MTSATPTAIVHTFDDSMTRATRLFHLSRRVVFSTACALASATCAAPGAAHGSLGGSVAPAAPAPLGSLMIVGGGPQAPALVRQFVDLATDTHGRAKIVVFAMASEDGATSGEEKAKDLRALGADARNVWLTREQADADTAARILDGVTGVWFGGGDQNRLIKILRGTAIAAAIHARYAVGAVIGGDRKSTRLNSSH